MSRTGMYKVNNREISDRGRSRRRIHLPSTGSTLQARPSAYCPCRGSKLTCGDCRWTRKPGCWLPPMRISPSGHTARAWRCSSTPAMITARVNKSLPEMTDDRSTRKTCTTRKGNRYSLVILDSRSHGHLRPMKRLTRMTLHSSTYRRCWWRGTVTVATA